MLTLTERLSREVRSALEKSYKDFLFDQKELLEPELSLATHPQFGHYQCNNALKLGKALKKNPREVAQEIVAFIAQEKGSSFIQKMEVAGPGFINFTLNPEFLAFEIKALLQDKYCGATPSLKKERVIVEFSSPNIAKELHVGHLRSTIIGDAIARLFEFLEYDVLRLNHIGDWGTQFGMLIAYLKEKEPSFLTQEKKADLAELMHWYRASKKCFDENPGFKKRAQLEVVSLQGGEEASLEAWQRICDISRTSFTEIYSLLDVQLEERGESYYNPFLLQVVSDLEKKGLITVSEGAKCVFLEGFQTREGMPLPMIVQKSDGGYNYDTTDMAAMLHRIEIEKAERIIIVTDAGQSLHFQMIAQTCEKAGYLDPHKVRFDHVPFGVVLGPDGKKFKTRSGDTEKLTDLIYEAIERSKAIFKERLPDASNKEIEEYARILGIDAIKYADLSCHRLKDYVFSYDRMLKFEGNTAAFLLYSYVRIQGIKRKVGKEITKERIESSPLLLLEPTEISLALHLRLFPEVLTTMSRELLPNRLCEYLYELAEKFNGFFRDCRVEGSEHEESRLLLCEAASRILGKGLHLLGLKTLPKM